MGSQAAFVLESSEGQSESSQLESSTSQSLQDAVGDDLFSLNNLSSQESNSISEQFGSLEIVESPNQLEDRVEVPESLNSQVKESATLHRLDVAAGGRDIDSTVLLPDNYDSSKEYPVVVGLHSFPGDGDGFGELIGAERLREQGVIVVLPSAQSGMWQSNEVDGISYFDNPFSEGHDDIEAVKETLNVVNEMYGVDSDNVNFVAFGHGVQVATEVARQLDQESPGAAKRLFLSAGSMVNTDDSSIGLPGTDVVHYEPGHDWMQDIGNMFTWTDNAEDFMPKLEEQKGCQVSSESNVDGVNRTELSCLDGSNVIKLNEKNGELSYPGQPERFDGIFGAGSTSKVDMTQIVIDMIKTGRVSRTP